MLDQTLLTTSSPLWEQDLCCNMHILHIVLHIFLMILLERICSITKTLHLRWWFHSFSWPVRSVSIIVRRNEKLLNIGLKRKRVEKSLTVLLTSILVVQNHHIGEHAQDSAGSRTWGEAGPGQTDPSKSGGQSPKNFFSALWASVWSKNMEGATARVALGQHKQRNWFRFNPLGPKSDQHQFSPIIIRRSSRVKVMRIIKLNALILNQIVLTVLTGKWCKLFVFSVPVHSLLFNMAVLYHMNG